MLIGNKVLRMGCQESGDSVACSGQDNSSTIYIVGATAEIFSDDEVGHMAPRVPIMVPGEPAIIRM